MGIEKKPDPEQDPAGVPSCGGATGAGDVIFFEEYEMRKEASEEDLAAADRLLAEILVRDWLARRQGQDGRISA